jgi:hypothetical protein
MQSVLPLNIKLEELYLLFEIPQFKAWYTYDNQAIIDMLLVVCTFSNSKLHSFLEETSVLDLISSDLIDQQQEYQHSGWSASLSVFMVKFLILKGSNAALCEFKAQ